jgi:hypothetical protein
MHLLCMWLALLAAPFWETKAPRDWSDGQVDRLLHDSPWAQMSGPAPYVQVYLATAEPMREAEAELARRSPKLPRGEPNEDYVDFLRSEGAHKLVLAIAFKDLKALADAQEEHAMEEESIMKVGRHEYKMEGHFPPVPSDPFLRLVYPRAATERDKTIVFELYVPGYGPYHDAEFKIKDMLYKGKLEM